jgi:hypothetical protein
VKFEWNFKDVPKWLGKKEEEIVGRWDRGLV